MRKCTKERMLLYWIALRDPDDDEEDKKVCFFKFNADFLNLWLFKVALRFSFSPSAVSPSSYPEFSYRLPTFYWNCNHLLRPHRAYSCMAAHEFQSLTLLSENSHRNVLKASSLLPRLMQILMIKELAGIYQKSELHTRIWNN